MQVFDSAAGPAIVYLTFIDDPEAELQSAEQHQATQIFQLVLVDSAGHGLTMNPIVIHIEISWLSSLVNR